MSNLSNECTAFHHSEIKENLNLSLLLFFVSETYFLSSCNFSFGKNFQIDRKTIPYLLYMHVKFIEYTTHAGLSKIILLYFLLLYTIETFI